MESFERVEIDALQSLLFTKVIATFEDQELLEGRDIIPLEILVEHLLLENGQLLIVEIAVIVCVKDPEDAQEGLLKVRLEHLGHAVVQRRYWVEDSFLSDWDYVTQADVALS